MYQHTQIGWIIILAMIPAPIILIIVGFATGQNYLIWLILLFVFLTMLFYKLTVTVSRQVINIHFGIGLIKKSFNLSEIESASKIKYSAIYGYGIRKIPKGWMYNVAGSKAVELNLKNDKVFWIGTDDPDGLERAIKSWLSN
jgi:hypothetical protein